MMKRGKIFNTISLAVAKIFISLFTILPTLMACSEVPPACPGLLEQLDTYISQNDCKTYGIYLTNEEGITYIDITGNHLYNKVLTDGYFFRNGKLVTYSFIDNKSQDNFIYRKNTEPFTGDINYNTHPSNIILAIHGCTYAFTHFWSNRCPPG